MRALVAMFVVAWLSCAPMPVGSDDAGSGGGLAVAGGSSTTAGGSSGGGSSAGGSSAGGSSGGASAGGVAAGGAAAGGAAGGGSAGGVTSLPHFSFFLTSYAALRRLSGSANGFGGDLRYGETGMGAGLRGADKICTEIAEASMPGSGAKGWRAFLSADQGENGAPVNAKDRIGNGPWYDRNDRLFAANLTNALTQRPTGCNTVICNDLPNEDGVLNHAPEGTLVDNHDILTGTNNQGLRYTGTTTGVSSNCLSWTTNSQDTTVTGKPRVGHSWPAASGRDWKDALTEAGCGAGVNLVEMGPPNPNIKTVGSGGGYGGFYCFALTP